MYKMHAGASAPACYYLGFSGFFYDDYQTNDSAGNADVVKGKYIKNGKPGINEFGKKHGDTKQDPSKTAEDFFRS